MDKNMDFDSFMEKKISEKITAFENSKDKSVSTGTKVCTITVTNAAKNDIALVCKDTDCIVLVRNWCNLFIVSCTRNELITYRKFMDIVTAKSAFHNWLGNLVCKAPFQWPFTISDKNREMLKKEVPDEVVREFAPLFTSAMKRITEFEKNNSDTTICEFMNDRNQVESFEV